MSNYRIENGKIFSVKSGNHVATLADGVVVMESGYNGLGKSVKEFVASLPEDPEAPVIQDESLPAAPAAPEIPEFIPEDEAPREFFGGPPNPVGTAAPEAPELPAVPADAAGIIDDIPDDQLPRFDAAYGAATPETAEFIRKHKMSADQITALIRRLENKLKGI